MRWLLARCKLQLVFTLLVDRRPRWCLRSKHEMHATSEQCSIQFIIPAFLHLNNNNWSVVGQLLTSSIAEERGKTVERNSTFCFFLLIEMKTRNSIELLPLRAVAWCERGGSVRARLLPLIMTFKIKRKKKCLKAFRKNSSEDWLIAEITNSLSFHEKIP